jgi:hypothetical protein
MLASEEARRLFAVDDDQLRTILDFAAAIPWTERKEFLLALAGRVAGLNGCNGGPGDEDVMAACCGLRVHWVAIAAPLALTLLRVDANPHRDATGSRALPVDFR